LRNGFSLPDPSTYELLSELLFKNGGKIGGRTTGITTTGGVMMVSLEGVAVALGC